MKLAVVASSFQSILAGRRRGFLLLAVLIGGASLRIRKSQSNSIDNTNSSTIFEPIAASGIPIFPYEEGVANEDTLRRIPAPYTSLFDFDTSGPALRSGECKPVPGAKDWPSKAEWNALNDSLGGALVPTIPIAGACYPEWSTYDREQCASLMNRWTDPWMHEEHPTSVMWPIWQGNTCLPTLNPQNSTCTIGGYPAYSVNATSIAQIQLAVNFARNKGLRLTVKNTGHDYSGKSCGAGALNIWTHNLQDLQYLPHYRLGRHSGHAMHVGAGVRTLDIYEFADKKHVSIVGGMCGSVGFAGGYFAGGGHSPLSSLLGMAADYILAIRVVTAGGRVVIATEETNSDLFWALRGGGASTFGITTSVVVRVHPKITLITSWISFETSSKVSSELFWQGVRAYFRYFAHFGNAGCYGYVNIHHTHEGRNTSYYSLRVEPMMAPNMTLKSFNQLVRPFFDDLSELGIPYVEDRRFFGSFYPGFVDSWPESLQVVTTPSITGGTRSFPGGLWQDETGFNAYLDAIRSVSEGGYHITGWQMALHNPSNASNSINPSLRHALAFFTTGVILPEDPRPEDLAASQAELDNILKPWREAAPANRFGGSYLNEASVVEPEWQDSLFGPNYPKLLRIKHKWDPTGVFYGTMAVGSELWGVRTLNQGIQTQNGPLCRL